MKKTYSTPETIITAVSVQHQLLAGSANGAAVTEENADPTLETLSRRRTFSIWEDEE